ncbi:MAG: hypothetical protein J6Y37_16575 [Paludibacteraceae bacterium]|nr:hypothetical protein [Paludibacteraceae bacterium]
MKKIGNIIGCNSLGGLDALFNFAHDRSGMIDGLPTMYVGLSNAEKNIAGFDILTKSYPSQNKWWTFSKTERRDDNIRDIEDFKYDVLRMCLSDITYTYVDFPRYSHSRLKSMIHYFFVSNDRKICFITMGSGFVFVYSAEYSTVFGISLSLCEYLGIGKKKVIDSLKANKYNEFLHDLSFMDGTLRAFVGNDTHYIPVLWELCRG